MIIPLWSIFALVAAFLVTSIPLLQEKFKADAFSLTLWIKIFSIFFPIPYVLHYGLPTDWHFYFFVGLTAILYSCSDVIYFRAIPIIGSGLASRLLPSSVVVTFILWFFIQPEQIDKYLANPFIGLAVLGVLGLFVFSATHVKKCNVSWQGFKLIWFVIFAACIGPILLKLSMQYAGKEQAPYAFVFVQAIMVSILMSGFYAVKRPVPLKILFSRQSITTGFILGLVVAITAAVKVKAFQLVDNPGFASMIMFTDALWVLLVYKLIGRKETGNIWAGLGIVLSAALIVLIKNL